MNETIKNIAQRYSCRDFADTRLTEKQISIMVEAALAAPSARNIQPWHIIVVQDKALIEQLDAEGLALLGAEEDKTMYDAIISRGGKLFYDAPCLFLIVSDGSKWATLDSGILCQNVVLAAESLGLGSCIVGLARVPLEGPRGEEFKKLLKFPDGYKFEVGVLAGKIISGKAPHPFEENKVTYVG